MGCLRWEEADPLLRKHLGELVKVLSRYLDPWIARGELRCANAEGLVLTLAAIVLSHNSLRRVFPGPVTNPETIFEAYAEFCIA